MKNRKLIAAMVTGALVLGVAGAAVAAPTVPGAVYGQPPFTPPGPPPHTPPVTPPRPLEKVQEDLQKAGVKDVAPDHWAANSVTVMLQAGLIAPDAQGNLNLEAHLTVEQGVAVFAKVLGVASKTDDVAAATEKAKQAGIIAAGTEGKTEFTRMDVARLLATALGVAPKMIASPADYPFHDFGAVADRNDLGLLAALYDLGIFKGYEDGTFRPGDVLDMSQLAILVDRILGAYAN
jgi:hypothetical protein